MLTPLHSHPTWIESQTLDSLTKALVSMGQPTYRAKQILDWVFVQKIRSFDQMSNLPAPLRLRLAETFQFAPMCSIKEQGSDDSTRKFLFQLHDHPLIETVLIPASPALYGEGSDRRTLCVSTQVGCAYGCRFCASGLDGFKRNLDSGEIVRQIMEVERISGEKIHNIVFMGMGEPLANYNNVMQAINIINAPWGLGIGARHITLSTSGLAPQIRKLADEPLQIRLAVSLHGATNETRNKIMPVNRKYPIEDLMDACDYFAAFRKQMITFEYILINGVNDSVEEARILARHAKRLRAKINLIPYNTVEGLDWQRPSLRRQELFLEQLTHAGASATLRREKGHDIAAACGQLRLRTEQELALTPIANS